MNIFFKNETEAEDYLAKVGKENDNEIDVMNVAFALSYLDNPQTLINKYQEKIAGEEKALGDVFFDLCAKENSDSVFVQARALKEVMADQLGYIGDDVHYDDLKNINLFSVMDRRMGLPIVLCLVAIHMCRAQGWNAHGVNFPGHFIMRLEKNGERVMIDPFQSCKILEAKDMRLILKRIMGEYAELSSDYYAPCTNRDMILRLQNNLKYRFIDAEKYDSALLVVHRMALIAPNDHRLNLDKAVLYSRVEQPLAAIENLEIYIDRVDDDFDKAEAEEFLIQLRLQLN